MPTSSSKPPHRLPPIQTAVEKNVDEAASTLNLVKKCGSGAFGSVYVGEKNVAVKIANHTDDHFESDALKLEARALWKCKKANVPHVIKMIDFDKSLVAYRDPEGELVGVKKDPLNGKRYKKYDALVMELARGGSLDKRLEKGRIDEALCKKVAKCMLEALSGLHRDAHIVHRDIKPANVVFDGNDIKLIDFGVSSDKSRPSTPIGTPYYMAPEVWNASTENPYNCKADLWSLGAMLYHAATGYVPFEAKSTLELYRKISNHAKSPQPLYFPRSVSRPCREFIASLLTSAKLRPSATEAMKHEWFVGKPAPVHLPRIKNPVANAGGSKLGRYRGINLGV